jgi:hypothetical protein
MEDFIRFPSVIRLVPLWVGIEFMLIPNCSVFNKIVSYTELNSIWNCYHVHSRGPILKWYSAHTRLLNDCRFYITEGRKLWIWKWDNPNNTCPLNQTLLWGHRGLHTGRHVDNVWGQWIESYSHEGTILFLSDNIVKWNWKPTVITVIKTINWQQTIIS